MGNIREDARSTVYAWNDTFSQAFETVLLPVLWETHATPSMADRPQNIINKELLVDCDILIALFSTKLGSGTGKYISWTVEEIEQFIDAGKPVMIYFDNSPIERKVSETEQFRLVRNFEKQCAKRGLYDSFSSSNQLTNKLERLRHARVLHSNYSIL